LSTPNLYYCHEPPRRFVDAACRPDPALMTPYERARLRWHAPATWVYDRVAARLDRRNVSAAGAVLTNSEHNRQTIRRHYGHGAYLHRLARGQDVQLEVLVGISTERLVRLYQGARVFLYAPHQEPFGLAVLEAMACARPVVAVAEGGPMESVEHEVTGLLTPR